MKKKDEKTYAIELNAQDFADVFTAGTKECYQALMEAIEALALEQED